MERDNTLHFHASSTGRSYINGKEFFESKIIKEKIKKLLESRIYKEIKENEIKQKSSSK